MAKQTGILPMTGKLGGLSFYRHKYYGMLVRQSNPVSRERYKNDPKFVRSRENNAELGNTSTNAALLRNGLQGFMFELRHGRLDNMMMKHFCKIRKEDTVSDRGKRCVRQGLELKPGMLGDFDLDPRHGLDWFVEERPVVDRQAGTITVSGYGPVHVPQGATHVAFAGVRVRLDFDQNERNVKESAYVFRSVEQGENPDEDIVLDLSGEMEIADGFEVWGMKVLFFQEVNGEKYALSVGAAKLLESNVVEGQSESEGESEGEGESESEIEEGDVSQDGWNQDIDQGEDENGSG